MENEGRNAFGNVGVGVGTDKGTGKSMHTRLSKPPFDPTRFSSVKNFHSRPGCRQNPGVGGQNWILNYEDAELTLLRLQGAIPNAVGCLRSLQNLRLNQNGMSGPEGRDHGCCLDKLAPIPKTDFGPPEEKITIGA